MLLYNIKDGQTDVHETHISKSETTVNLKEVLSIIQGGEKVKNWNGETPLMLTSKGCSKECLEWLYDTSRYMFGPSQLVAQTFAKLAAYNTADMVHVLIKAGADVNTQDRTGKTALHWAAEANDHHECVKALLSNEADISILSHNKRTALHHAAANGFVLNLSLLINAGADPNAQDNQDQTPLILAAEGKYLDCLKELVSFGADLNLTDDKGNTALDIATRANSKMCVNYLINAGADINVRRNSDKSSGPTSKGIGAHTGQLEEIYFDAGVIPGNARSKQGYSVLKGKQLRPAYYTLTMFVKFKQLLGECVSSVMMFEIIFADIFDNKEFTHKMHVFHFRCSIAPWQTFS